MNFSNIERLEEKVNQVVQQITFLKDKNKEIEQENTELKSMLEDRNRLIQSYEEQIDQLKQQTQESSLFKEKEEEIKGKISGMLGKLDQLESMI
jgi:chromosome segregation ATPase